MDDELDLLDITNNRDDPDDPDEDPGVDDDDDPEGDCMSFHNCQGSQWGYCLLTKGHDGDHLCTKCGSSF